MPIPLIPVAAGLGLISLSPASDPPSGGAELDEVSKPPAVPLGETQSGQAAIPFSLGQWTALIDQLRGDIPHAFVAAWIAHESAGNPCSVGRPGALAPGTSLPLETGIFQLMAPDNISAAGTTIPKMRAACIGITQQASRPLTTQEATEHMRAGLQFIRHCRSSLATYLASVGAPQWTPSTPGYWCAVKLVHNVPATLRGCIQAAAHTLGTGHPANWSEVKGAVASCSLYQPSTASYSNASLLAKAELVGLAV